MRVTACTTPRTTSPTTPDHPDAALMAMVKQYGSVLLQVSDTKEHNETLKYQHFASSNLLAVVMTQLCSIAAVTGMTCVIDDGIDIMGVSAIRASCTNSFHKIITDWRIASTAPLHGSKH